MPPAKEVRFDLHREVDWGYSSPCWERPEKPLNGRRYIQMWDGRAKKAMYGHRAYYEHFKGPIPEGMEIDHLCRNRPCVNPDHLEAVTSAENIRRGAAAKLTEEAVRDIRSSSLNNCELGRRYGVDGSTISRVRSGERWQLA